ncbi:MAG: hypothetical protein E6686_03495 [Lachnospiraceae bacterium]|nr:hypothetical protein [Lachnospiraceae bacterium]
MKIYQLIKTEMLDTGIFKYVEVKKKELTVKVPDNTKIVKSEEEGKKIAEAALEAAKKLPRKERYENMRKACDHIFAVEAYDTTELSMDKLMYLLQKELKLEDIKFICEKEPWIAERYIEYMQNVGKSEEFKGEPDSLDRFIQNASMITIASSLLIGNLKEN